MTDDHRDPTTRAGAAPPPPPDARATAAAAPPDAPNIDCLDAARQLWDCLDGELTAERMQLVRAHLEACSRCAPHFDFERRFLEALATTRPAERAPAGLRQRVVRALRGAGFAPG